MPGLKITVSPGWIVGIILWLFLFLWILSQPQQILSIPALCKLSKQSYLISGSFYQGLGRLQNGIHLLFQLFGDHKSYFLGLRLRSRYSLFKITFGGMTIVLANKSIMMRSFSLLSVSVMISSLNDYWKPLLNRVGSLSLSKIITRAMKWPTLLFIKEVNSQPSPANFGY